MRTSWPLAIPASQLWGFRIAYLWCLERDQCTGWRGPLSALSDQPDVSKSEVGGNAKEAGRVLVLAFFQGGEVAAQMARAGAGVGEAAGSSRVRVWQEALELGSGPFFTPGRVEVRQFC